jgi:hypothetical protein
MVTPIRPEDVGAAKAAALPDFVLEAVNHLLATKISGGRARLMLTEVVDEILRRAPEGTARQDCFTKHWVDFEPVYRDAGWSVVYDKPGYNESGEESYLFGSKR